MADMTDQQRSLMAQQLMGGASQILPPGLTPRPQMAAPVAGMGGGMPPAVANAIAPNQGALAAGPRQDLVSGTPPPFPAGAATPGMDPMTAIRPPQGPGIDLGGERRIPGIVPNYGMMSRNI